MVLLNVAAARGPVPVRPGYRMQNFAPALTPREHYAYERDGVTCGPRRYLSCRRPVEDERCYVNRRDECVGLRRPIDLQYGRLLSKHSATVISQRLFVKFS